MQEVHTVTLKKKRKNSEKRLHGYVESMQKPTNAKTNCNIYSANNKETEEDHVKDERTRLIMGIKKRQTMVRDRRELKKIVLESRCTTNRSEGQEAEEEDKE